MQENDIDRIFSKELSGKHTIPPASVWQQIDTSLQHQRKERKRRQIRWRVSGIAASLLLTIGVAFHLFTISDTASTPESSSLVSESRTDPATDPLVDRFSESASPSESSTAVSEDNRLARTKETVSDKPRIPTTSPTENTSKTATTVTPFPKAQPALAFQNNLSEIPERRQRIPASVTISTSTLHRVESEEENTEPRNQDDDNLIVSVLNVLSRSIVPEGKEVQFSNDEEGTISIGISKNLVRQKL